MRAIPLPLHVPFLAAAAVAQAALVYGCSSDDAPLSREHGAADAGNASAGGNDNRAGAHEDAGRGDSTDAATGDVDHELDAGSAGEGARDDAGSRADGGEVSRGPCAGPAPGDYAYELGVSAFGRERYIEYVPGDLPIVISAPHGGTLRPDEIPAQPGDEQDGGSQEYTRLLHQYLGELTGHTPHVIINHLTRNRLQANATREGASYGNAFAAQAWDEYHAYIEDAKAWVTSACGKGHYFDLHTNGHAEGWVELAFALDGPELDLPDAELDTPELREQSTLRALVSTGEVSFVEVVRGPTSLGGLLEAAGVEAVPSPTYPGPAGGGYFNGGYNVRRHGSRQGGVVDGTQIESHFQYVNSGASKREAYARVLAEAIRTFMETHYGFELSP